MSTARGRKRPNSYASKACERCKRRKQRCLREDDEEICANCQGSGATCVYEDRSEDARQNGNTTAPGFHTSPTPPPHAPPQHQSNDTQQSWVDSLGQTNASTSRITPLTRPNPTIVTPTLPIARTHISPVQIGAISSPTLFDTANGVALVSLEASAEPHYVGESSGAFWSTVVGKGITASMTDLPMPERSTRARERSPETSDQTALLAALQRGIPSNVADKVLLAVFKHLQPRYPFMDWMRFNEHWQARDGLLLAVALRRQLNKEASVAAYFVLMVLAIGSQLCKNDQLSGLLRAQEYYTLAQPLLPVIVQLHNLNNIQGLLLLAMYSFRDSHGPSVWYLSGVTMRLCCGLGLHRSPSAKMMESATPYDLRMKKRVFWTCYTLDRMMSLTLGRPPGISDDDIDVDYPETVVDELDLPIQAMRKASLVSSVHYFKIKRIESRIQREIYSVATRQTPKASITRLLLQEIDAWEGDIPAEASLPDLGSVPSCSRDWFMLRGMEARLHLLRPICTEQSDEAREFVPLLAKYAARGCDLQKRTHHLGQPCSSTSAHSTYICGLALLYAIYLQPRVLNLRETFTAISAASGTLFAYAQSDPSLAALHDFFEELSSGFIDKLSVQEAPVPAPPVVQDTGMGWTRNMEEATNNMDTSVVSGYVDLLTSLGLNMPVDNAPADSLWDLASFTPFDADLFNNGQTFQMPLEPTLRPN